VAKGSLIQDDWNAVHTEYIISQLQKCVNNFIEELRQVWHICVVTIISYI